MKPELAKVKGAGVRCIRHSSGLARFSNCRGHGLGQGQRPILRMWRARSTPDKSGEYVQHATSRVCPTLRAIAAHRGAYLLRRAVGGAVELVVLTIWESMESVRKFAGDEPEQAVVEPEAGVHGVVSDRKGGKSCGELRCLQPRARFPLNRSYVD